MKTLPQSMSEAPAGYIAVVPEVIEIQELDLEERLHDRRQFVRELDGRWTQTSLVP